MNSGSPLVSVLMTSYNRESYIGEAIKSVLNSTYRNLELIIVDDCSTDKTREIANYYAESDPRIKVITNETNLGDYPNRNKAADHANGKYLKYLDSDDLIYSHGLEIMVEAMETFPESGIGFSDYKYDGIQSCPYEVNSHDAYYRHYFSGGFLYMGPTGSIYRRSVFEKLGKFDTQYGVATDLAFNLKIASSYPVVVFQRDLFWWRPHDGQEIRLKKNAYEYLNDKINSKYLSDNSCPLQKPESREAFNNLKNILARRVWKSIFTFRLGLARRKVSDYSLSLSQIILAIFPSKVRRLIYP